jgi:ornithine carbamoyltransferase
MTENLLVLSDLGRAGLKRVLWLARAKGNERPLKDKGVALFFEHPSARTRNAFEMAVVELGGHPVTIRRDEVGIDSRESAEDVARTLGCYHSVICGRVERHRTLERMAGALSPPEWDVPVVNLLSDLEHPSQAVADLLTIAAHRPEVAGTTVCYIGDANNVCRSLMAAAGLAEFRLHVAAPPGYCFSEQDLDWGRSLGAEVSVFDDPVEAVEQADVLYTDVWVSMGQQQEAAVRRDALSRFRIDEELVGKAPPGALVMHCLPAHRGEEISAGVLEGKNSVVWEQAANRLTAARGILAYLVERRKEAR